jgi:hypothetical protein
VQRTLRSTPVGFASTENRPCLREGGGVERSASAPGPDQYNPDYYTVGFKAAKAATSSRKVGVFGTTGPRFRPKNEVVVPAVVTLVHVGPGS